MRNDILVFLNLASGARYMIAVILLCVGLFSCDSMGDMYDDLTRKTPICVDPSSAAASPDGRGWKNAYRTIDDAVTNAPAGSEIWIKKGSGASAYTISSVITNNKDLSFYGGFDGNEGDRDERSSDAALTVLHGDFTTQIMSVTSGDIVIDGLTFENGNTSGNGGAISFNNVTAVINNCRFTTNHAEGGLLYGGAIYVSGVSSLSIKGCYFYANASVHGNAIYSDTTGKVAISKCVFNTNTYSGALEGGAISNTGSGVMSISDSTFTGNHSQNYGGAISLGGSGTTVISRCTFDDNQSTSNNGGAIALTGTGVLTVSGSTFTKNLAAGANGGAIYCSGGTLNVSDSVFGDKDDGTMMNSAGGNGGAVYTENCALNIEASRFYRNSASSLGGGVCCNISGTGNIRNSTFIGNTAISGGGVHIYQNVSVYMENLLIQGNTVSGSGGGICMEGSSPSATIVRTIISGNTAGGDGGGLHQNTGTLVMDNSLMYGNNTTANGDQVFCNNMTPGQLNVKMYNCTIIGGGSTEYFHQCVLYNCVLYTYDVNVFETEFYNSGMLAGMNFLSSPYSNYSRQNITSSSFIDFSNNNYRPSAGSVLINNGTGVAGIGSRDLDGNPRFNGNVDIGAYETR